MSLRDELPELPVRGFEKDGKIFTVLRRATEDLGRVPRRNPRKLSGDDASEIKSEFKAKCLVRRKIAKKIRRVKAARIRIADRAVEREWLKHVGECRTIRRGDCLLYVWIKPGVRRPKRAKREADARKEYEDTMRSARGDAWVDTNMATVDAQWAEVKGLFL